MEHLSSNLWVNQNVNQKIDFILEQLWFKGKLNIWDIPSNLQTTLVSCLNSAPEGVVGFIWTTDLRSTIVWLLGACLQVKESSYRITEILENEDS